MRGGACELLTMGTHGRDPLVGQRLRRRSGGSTRVQRIATGFESGVEQPQIGNRWSLAAGAMPRRFRSAHAPTVKLQRPAPTA